jgi:hypothetical protein
MVLRIALAGLLIWVSESAVAQVSAKFYLDKATYAIGEPIFVNFQAVNEGSEPQRLYSADPNSDCSAFHISVSNDRPTTKSCVRAISCPSSSVTLQPHEKHVERILLNLAHNVSAPGDYSVKAETWGGFAYGSKMSLTAATLHFQVDTRPVLPEVFQSLLDQLHQNSLKRIEAARALASVAPPFLEGTLLTFADDPDLQRFAPLAFHRLNTPASNKALADLLNKTRLGSFEHWQAEAYLDNDECADAAWQNADKTHISP